MQLAKKPKVPIFPIAQQVFSFSAVAVAAVADAAVDDIAKLINDHPFPLPRDRLPPPFLDSPLLDSILTRLFAAHAATPKALYLFRLALHRPQQPPPSPSAFTTTLHILTRARHFDAAFELVEEVARSDHSSLLTPKSLAVLLSRFAKFRPFNQTIDAFERAERAWVTAGLAFGVNEFNVLLRAYCVLGRVGEARAIFRQLHSRFPPNSRILNTLLLGFKESGNLTAFDLFYHEMIPRGFEPDTVTYCIRMDAYCKKMRFLDALALLDDMQRRGLLPTIETMTTLIHGAGIAKDPLHARRLFDEIPQRGLLSDRGAYNALLGAFARVGDFGHAMEIMNEMEEKEMGLDDVSYYTMFAALNRRENLEGFLTLYKRMVEGNFLPRARTVVLLMKVFCENGRADLGLELWDYLVEKGCCPHRHALDLLVTGLCCQRKVAEAHRSLSQVLERGRMPSERAFGVLEGFLRRLKESEKLKELHQMRKRVRQLGPGIMLDHSGMNSELDNDICS